MDRLDMALALIQEAKEERKRLEAMEKEIDKIPSGPNYWAIRCEIERRYSPTPHKSVVNNNLKTARRLLAREYISN
jgi:hypothetical protein